MIGIDTNILIRFIMGDDPRQHEAAVAFLEEKLTEQEPGFINIGTLLEMVWVLRSRCRIPKEGVLLVLERLLRTETIKLQHEREVSRAFAAWKQGEGSFSDLLIGELNAAAGCAATFTFDKEASRLPGFSLLT